MIDESDEGERGAGLRPTGAPAPAPRRASTTSREHAARPQAELTEQELTLATEHPRGTERRRLLPYREALNDPAAYARLPEKDRDVIVRWAEVRRLIAGRGVDHDASNLADPLLPVSRLRAHVLEGERLAAHAAPVADEGGDLIALIAHIRRSGAGA